MPVVRMVRAYLSRGACNECQAGATLLLAVRGPDLSGAEVRGRRRGGGGGEAGEGEEGCGDGELHVGLLGNKRGGVMLEGLLRWLVVWLGEES